MTKPQDQLPFGPAHICAETFSDKTVPESPSKISATICK